MNKKLILGLALAVVLVSGSLFSAQAECGLGCPHFSLPTCWTCQAPARDYDRPSATCQGAFQFGPVTPDIMAAPGAG